MDRDRRQIDKATWLRPGGCQNTECAEVAFLTSGEVLLRNPVSPRSVVWLPREAWAELVEGVRAGEFDDL